MNRVFASFGAVILAAAFASTACEESTEVTPNPTPDGGDSPSTEADASAPIDCPAPTGGPTMHRDDVEGEQVWTAAGSPHIVTYDVNVRNGAKLTIEPCAEVLVAKGKHINIAYPGSPNIGGTLIAEGTATKPIKFAGQDGARWASIYVSAPGTARLKYVTLEGGGGGDFEDNTTINVLGDGALPADPLLFVDHVTIKNSLGTGLWMQRGSNFVEGSTDLTITGSGGEQSPYPIQIEEHSMDRLPVGKYTGNKVDEILLRAVGATDTAGLALDATLHERGVPYHMGKTKLDYFVVGPKDGDLTATLTIEPGIVMRFEAETTLKVQGSADKPSTGAIRALGTAEKPIVFTSAAASPKAGDWRGLWFGGIPSDKNKLDHVRIEYAGFDCSCVLNSCSNIGTHNGAVILTSQPGSAFITNSVFKEVDGHAVTEGFDGTLVDFRPTNDFQSITGCVQTMPRVVVGACPNPKPACDGQD